MLKKKTITVKNLGKRYRIGHAEEEHETLAAKVLDLIVAPLRNFRNIRSLSSFKGKNTEEEDIIWAIEDLNFEVEQGEVLGVIGKNGAGKSTLLKVLSQITEPTTGCAVIEGRVSSLLEVGTGFHKELTGRENVYLNGTILGMSKNEIDGKFDQIVEFAGVKKFINTPVKRYSSGMKVRLGFAVAAHLEPDVMIIDEVLAVGDVEFQKKCLSKMKELANSGRTVIFVSHQMNAVKNLCTRCILLHDGKIHSTGETQDIINKYLKICRKDVNVSLDNREDRRGNGTVRITRVHFENNQGEQIHTLMSGEHQDLVLTLSIEPELLPLENYTIDIGLDNEYGERVAFLSTDMVTQSEYPEILDDTEARLAFSFKKLALIPGRYYATFFCRANSEIADWIGNAIFFDVEPGDFYGTGKFSTEKEGLVLLDYNVEINNAHVVR